MSTAEKTAVMKNYLLRIRPLEPYFFGNERSFGFNGNQTYYITSETMPAQTTIFGGLRFALLRHYNSERNYSDEAQKQKKENASLIGESSFSMDCEGDFGAIHALSPIFILKDEHRLIPAPLDHAVRRDGITANGEDPKKRYPNEVYTPFGDYRPVSLYDTCSTDSVSQLLPFDYVDKEGVADCFIDISCEQLPVVHRWHSADNPGIFGTVEKVGIQKKGDEEAYFKRLCCTMMPGFCFGAIVTLSGDVVPQDQIVYLGQQKSAFRFEFEEQKGSPDDFVSKTGELITNAHKDIDTLSSKSIYYALGDLYANCDRLYGAALCSFAQVRDFRYLSTSNDAKTYYAKLIKSEALYRLVRAGSIFITDSDEISNALLNDKGCKKIGMNTIAGGRIR